MSDFASGVRRHRVLLTLILLTLLFVGTAKAERVLILVPDHFGANTNLFYDHFMRCGWDVTFAGQTEVVRSCIWATNNGMQSMTMDTLISEVTDITYFDALFIATGSSGVSTAFDDLADDLHTKNLIRSALDNGIPVAAWCYGIKVLIAAHVLDGVKVSASSDLIVDLRVAGATYMGTGIPAIYDHGIITGTRNKHFYRENVEAVIEAVHGTYAPAASSSKGGDQ